jgi:hypothetical protein
MFILLATAFLLLATTISWAQPVTVIHTLAWDRPTQYENGDPAQPESLDHYNMYICDAPILAGGPTEDDPKVAPAFCVGNLKIIEVGAETLEASYDAPGLTGTIYYRVSALKVGTGTPPLESRLSNEVSAEFDLNPFKPPVLLRIVIQ